MKNKPKIIVIGQPNPIPIKKNRIEVMEGVVYGTNRLPKITDMNSEDIQDYNFIELIAKDYLHDTNKSLNRDLIFCYNDPEERGEGFLYFGQWNDGVV